MGIDPDSVYETVVAAEPKGHGFELYYYDNRSNGEVDHLIDDCDFLSVIPLGIKSGKDYTVHSALNRFTSNPDHGIKKAFALSNNREIATKGMITHMPIHYVSFMKPDDGSREIRLPEIRSILCVDCVLVSHPPARGVSMPPVASAQFPMGMAAYPSVRCRQTDSSDGRSDTSPAS